MKQNHLLKQCLALLALPAVCASVSAQYYGVSSEPLLPGMTSPQGEEIVEAPPGFSALLNLDDHDVKTLVEQGSIAIHIPQHLRGSVEAIVLRRPVVFKNNKATAFADAQLNGQQLIVDVDQSTIGRIGYQPVQLNVYETQFSSVVLKYVANFQKTGEKTIGDAERDSPLLTLKLKSGNGFVGRIRNLQQLNLESTLGKISLKLPRVSKIQFQGGGRLTVQMASGNLVSGRIRESELVFANRWGTETIQLKDIAQLVFGVANGSNQQPKIQ